MSHPNDERQYSEEEFALILRMAAEVGAGPAPAPPRQGLTLSQIQTIAAEVGIDPEKVSRAAVLLSSATDTTISRLLGGQARHRLERSVPGQVPPTELGRVVDVVRRDLATQGETREVLGALEWKGGTSTVTALVSITPRGGKTVLQASIDRTESLAGIYAGVGLPVAGVSAALLVSLVFGESSAGIAAGILSGFVPSLLLARTLWKRSTKKWRRRILHLMSAMTAEAEAAIERTAEAVPPLEGPSRLDVQPPRRLDADAPNPTGDGSAAEG